MTIHSSHPFATPEGDKSAVRQVRGRLPAPVSIWTATVGDNRAGLTVSSFLVVEGEPGRVIGAIDPESDLSLLEPHTVVVNLLGAEHQFLADAFAGTAPAPGGPFTLATWESSDWGPVLADAVGWFGLRLARPMREVGWSVAAEGEIEHLEVTDEAPLIHARGRYRTL